MLAASLVACGGDEDEGSGASKNMLFSSEEGDAPSSSSSSSPAKAPLHGGTASGAPAIELSTSIDPATGTHPEVVQLVMAGKDGDTWFCTGALVSEKVVVTAAHCLQSELFTGWEAVAPALKGRPRSKGKPLMYDTRWAAVEHPDLGIVVLETPIALPQYAQLTDVGARVDKGERLEVQTIVRTAELPEAPFKKTGTFAVSSTKQYGYTQGYGVPLFSRGGDSGAGMFLIENGQMTHKVIGLVREPDPARKIDHLSRVDRAFMDWVSLNDS